MSVVLIGGRARHALFTPLLRSVRAINASLGPHGRALLYEASSSRVGFATDGLTIALEMAESEGMRSVGPRLLKETLFAAHRDLGDGAARIACILGAIIEEGAKLVAAGYPPQELADEILQSGRVVERRLAEQLCPSPDLRLLAHALTADAALADAIATAVDHAGAHGIVDVGDQPGDLSDVEFGRGFSIDLLLASEHLGPVAPATVLEFDNIFVLVANEIVSEFGRLGPILEQFASRKKSLAIVARGVTGHALEALVRNRRELGLHVVALKPMDVSERAGELLEDLAIATGATLVSAELGRSLDSLKPSMLGRAKRMHFAKAKALFTDPGGDRTTVEQRRAWLASEADRVRYLAYDREHALRRSARLAGAWSQLRVGGRSSFETSAKVGEAKAAVATLQACITSGVVAGGGSVLVREAWRLRAGTSRGSEPRRAADGCVARGLEAVAMHIARNAGFDPTVFLTPLRASTAAATGFDARTGRIGDVVSVGIADPLSITGGVLARAVSAAATMLRVEALICR